MRNPPNKYHCQVVLQESVFYILCRFTSVYMYVSGMELRMCLTEGHLNRHGQNCDLWFAEKKKKKISPYCSFKKNKTKKQNNLKGFKNKMKSRIIFATSQLKWFKKHCFKICISVLIPHIQTVRSSLRGSSCLASCLTYQRQAHRGLSVI